MKYFVQSGNRERFGLILIEKNHGIIMISSYGLSRGESNSHVVPHCDESKLNPIQYPYFPHPPFLHLPQRENHIVPLLFIDV